VSEHRPGGGETTPLAQLMFGWAFAMKRGGVFLAGLGALLGLLIADEIWRPLQPAGLEPEGAAGFYATLGFLSVAAGLLIAHLVGATLGRLQAPYPEERDDADRA
jgi:hypothetical protein